VDWFEMFQDTAFVPVLVAPILPGNFLIIRMNCSGNIL